MVKYAYEVSLGLKKKHPARSMSIQFQFESRGNVKKLVIFHFTIKTNEKTFEKFKIFSV